MCEKLIGMLRRNAILPKVFFGKILEIVRDNYVGPAAYGGGQNVSVFWIGQLERGDEVFEVLDDAVADVLVHEFPCALEIVGGEIRAVLEKGADPLVMNHGRPLGSEEIGECELH